MATKSSMTADPGPTEPARSAGSRTPMVLGVVALVVGACWAWFGGVPFSHDVSQLCPGFGGLKEGALAGTSQTWWPPGAIECQITEPGGGMRHTTVFLWRDYASVALLAAAVGLAAAARQSQAFGTAALAAGLTLLSAMTLLFGN